MQRQENGLVIISCDFTGVDWDEQVPMIEGHRGAVLSLAALKMAVEGGQFAPEKFQCTMCRREFEAGEKAWRHPNPPKLPGINPGAIVCWDCIRQADMVFGKDPDVEWERRIPADERWR